MCSIWWTTSNVSHPWFDGDLCERRSASWSCLGDVLLSGIVHLVRRMFGIRFINSLYVSNCYYSGACSDSTRWPFSGFWFPHCTPGTVKDTVVPRVELKPRACIGYSIQEAILPVYRDTLRLLRHIPKTYASSHIPIKPWVMWHHNWSHSAWRQYLDGIQSPFFRNRRLD